MLAALSGATSGCPGSVGGGCAYKDYEGVIIIKDIRPLADERSAARNPDEQLFVSYIFRASAPDAPAPVGNFSGETHLTGRDIEQKAITIGKQFRGKAKYIEHGSCNPGPYLDKFENWQ